MTAVPAWRPRAWLALAVALTLGKLWLTRGQPVFAIGSAGLDDRLFLELARHLVHGEWLGPYNDLTLAKGAGYPLFIAAVHVVGVPLFLAQQLLYVAACALLVRALRPAIASAGARCACYLLLLWNPMSFEAPAMGRVLRQHLTGPLAVLVIASLVALYLRRAETGRRPAAWAGLLGGAAALFYLTREESVWLLPSGLLLAGAGLFGAWRISRAALWRTAAWLGLAAAVMALPLLAVSFQNLRHYGWFGTCELRGAAFAEAYGAMLRVKAGPELAYVPVTREARVAMAQASPAFAEVQAQFDTGLARGWAAASSYATKLPGDQEQIGGGWLPWALREAVTRAGHARTAGEATAFYAQLARELNTAADAGRLPAGPRRSGYVPPWRDAWTAALPRHAYEFGAFVVRFSRFSARPLPSSGGAEELALFREMTGERLSPVEGDATPLPPGDLRRIEILQAIGKALRPVLFGLFLVAQGLAGLRLLQCLWLRRLDYPLVVAAAAWGGVAASVLMHALIETTSYPVLTISSFAPVYPLVLLFIIAVGWDVAVAVAARRTAPATTGPATPDPASPREFPLPPAVARALPWAAGLLALAPFVAWQGQFAELFWFGDDLFLIDQISYMGLWHWSGTVFSENFVPLFKVLWGGLMMLSGSYLVMLWALWLTHAANTVLLGRLLLRAGFAWPAALAASLLFALPAVNIETLGWSVQWSALLATTFLLLALVWLERQRAAGAGHGWRVWLPLFLFSAASACSFSRGVLTGPVVALVVLWPAAAPGEPRYRRARWGAALAALLPALLVALAIKSQSGGNHQHLAGHELDVLEFATRYFLLNPFHTLLATSLQPAGLALAAGLKVGVVAGGLLLARGRPRELLIALLAFDLGNSLLLGIGRYHTGFEASMSSRYQYGSLLATLPFLALLLGVALERLCATAPRQRWAAAALALALAAYGFAGWPAALKEFTGWRGTDIRRQLAAPATNDPAATMPTVDFLHVERAKALVRAYDLR